MRLLEKNNLVVGGYQPKMSGNGMEGQSAILCKLGQLEDIEEELGIELLTLFKALKNGIYYKETLSGRIYEKYINEFLYISFEDKALIYLTDDFAHSTSMFMYYEFDDYGKTWALTKEELL